MFRRALVLGGLLALLPTMSQAALVMLVEGVTGSSTIPNHVGWFNVDSVQWAIERGNPARPQAFVVALESTSAMATLMQASASGTGLKKIVIDVLYTSQEPLTLDSRLTCEDPLIRDFSAVLQPAHRERVSLSVQCGRIAWEKFDYTANGQLLRQAKGSWNFKTNTP